MIEIILLAFTGYISIFAFRLFGRSRSRSGWDFLVQTGLGGFLAYVIAQLIVLGYDFSCSTNFFAIVHCPSPRHAVLQADGFLDWYAFALSLLIAPFLGYGAYRMFYANLTKRVLEHIGALHLPGEVDILSTMNRQGRVVVASLDNDKIYVGQINSVTTDPDETLKLVAMVNFLSGTRNAASSSGVGVVYNYGIEYDPNAPTILYLDFNNIVSISEFSIESFINSIESGYALIEEIALVQFTACLLAIEYISSEDELLSRLQ